MDGFNVHFFSIHFSYPFFKLGITIEYCVILIIKETLKHIWNIIDSLSKKFNHILCVSSSFSLYQSMLCRSFSFTCILKQKLIILLLKTSLYKNVKIYHWEKEIKKLYRFGNVKISLIFFLEGFFFQLAVSLVDIF